MQRQKSLGYNHEAKEPITNPFGFYHHTVPLRWQLFEVLESSEYAEKGRKSRWAKEVGQYTYVHFDNNFKIICYEKRKDACGNKVAYGEFQYLMFKKPFEKLLEDVWSTKDCQYVEVSDFGTLEKLFMERFVNDKKTLRAF